MQEHRQREKQTPCREPNVGLDPGTLGSCPEPKADAQPLSHPHAPLEFIINKLIIPAYLDPIFQFSCHQQER